MKTIDIPDNRTDGTVKAKVYRDSKYFCICREIDKNGKFVGFYYIWHKLGGFYAIRCLHLRSAKLLFPMLMPDNDIWNFTDRHYKTPELIEIANRVMSERKAKGLY